MGESDQRKTKLSRNSRVFFGSCHRLKLTSGLYCTQYEQKDNLKQDSRKSRIDWIYDKS